MSARKSVLVLAVLAALTVASLAQAANAPTAKSTPPAAHEMKAPVAKAPATKAPATPKVDLNTAPRGELVALPQIGEVKADKVIAARPFKTKSELVSKGIVTRAEYAKLAPHVVARGATEAPRLAHHEAKPAKAAPKTAK